MTGEPLDRGHHTRSPEAIIFDDLRDRVWWLEFSYYDREPQKLGHKKRISKAFLELEKSIAVVKEHFKL